MISPGFLRRRWTSPTIAPAWHGDLRLHERGLKLLDGDNAACIVAKLDRLSRNVGFILALMNSGVG